MADATQAETEALLPCPFCKGAAEIITGPITDRFGVRCTSCGVWRDDRATAKLGAIYAWNTRAALRPEPSPIRTKLPSPCDDEALERELVEAVKIARTSDAKYVSDILDATSVLNIVLQITEGSDILDRLIERHLNDHFATLADATAQVIERDFPELKPQPSPDDAALLDEHADALAEWKHIESEYAETSPNYVAAKARFEQARAAVLARMSRVAALEAALMAIRGKASELVEFYASGVSKEIANLADAALKGGAAT